MGGIKMTESLFKQKILRNHKNPKELGSVLNAIHTSEDVSLEEKVQLMLLVFEPSSSNTSYPNIELVNYLWNFVRVLYKDMNKLILRMIPAVYLPSSDGLTEKQIKLFREITGALSLVMVYMKDDSEQNIGTICQNVLVLSKTILKQKNYRDFFALLQATFFNPKHNYQLKMLAHFGTKSGEAFLLSMLNRFRVFIDVTEDELKVHDLTKEELFDEFSSYYLFYVNYCGDSAQWKAAEKYTEIFCNLKFIADDVVKNCLSVLRAQLELLKLCTSTPNKSVDMANSFRYYMSRLSDPKVINTNRTAFNTLAAVAVCLEKNKVTSNENVLKGLPTETIHKLIKTIRATVEFNIEPTRSVCDLKDCKRGGKYHTITNLMRFAMKLFVVQVNRLNDGEVVDEEIMRTIAELNKFHFFKLGRLQCPSKAYNEHLDIRRVYNAFVNRSKINPSPYLIELFEDILSYTFNHNLQTLVVPTLSLLSKYYQDGDHWREFNRIEWMLLLMSLAKDDHENLAKICFNWAVKRQTLSKEEINATISQILDMKFDFKTDLFNGADLKPIAVFTSILENIAAYNYKAFKVIQECLLNAILKTNVECPFQLINLLFHAPGDMLTLYASEIEKCEERFASEPGNTSTRVDVARAVLHTLQYAQYVEELRKEFQTVKINSLYKRELDLSSLSLKREQQEMGHLLASLKSIVSVVDSQAALSAIEVTQIKGILKRNIRYFQLAGLELQEVHSCKLLYDIAVKNEDMDSQLLAIGNLIMHSYFIMNDPCCRAQFPRLAELLSKTGYGLLCGKLERLHEQKEPTQIIIVFGICNMIRVTADSSAPEHVYDQLKYLKMKIDSTQTTTTSVTEMQFQLLSYQLFLRYTTASALIHLAVIREIFSTVRLLHKTTDLYSLSIYDVLVDMVSYGVSRYEHKGLDYYIGAVLQFFMGLGCVRRILDSLLIYGNWVLHCENMEKCEPILRYIAEIIEPQKGGDGDIKFVDQMLSTVSSVPGGCIPTDIMVFKLHCLMARKCYIEGAYSVSRDLYKNTTTAHELLGRIFNRSMALDFKQFFINTLFQLSHLYWRLESPRESRTSFDQTVAMIRTLNVNTIALRQEVQYQELSFAQCGFSESLKGTPNVTDTSSPISYSPLKMVRSCVESSRKRRKKSDVLVPKVVSSSKLEKKTVPGKSKITKTPTAKASPPVLVRVDSPSLPPSCSDENSSTVGNVREPAKKTVRKIPVRIKPTIAATRTTTRRNAAAKSTCTPVKQRTLK